MHESSLHISKPLLINPQRLGAGELEEGGDSMYFLFLSSQPLTASHRVKESQKLAVKRWVRHGVPSLGTATACESEPKERRVMCLAVSLTLFLESSLSEIESFMSDS